MRRKNDFENSLWLTKLSLLTCGIRIYDTKLNFLIEYFIDHWLFYIHLFGLYSVIIGEIIWFTDGVEVENAFVELSLVVPCVTLSILGTLKSLSLYYNRKTIIEIIEKLRDMHPDVSNEEIRETNEDDKAEKADNKAQITIAKESVKFLNNVIYLLTISTVAAMLLFCFNALISMGYDYFKTGQVYIKYPYPVNYYFDIYTRIWPLEYLHQVWGTAVVCVSMFASETIFYILCSYIEMHFRITCHRLEHIVSRSSKETKKHLADVVRQHLTLIKFVDQTEKLYSNVMLFHIAFSSFLICLSGFNITVVEDIDRVSAFITFLFMNLSQIFLFCFFGDKIMTSSTAVSAAIYNCAWYDFDLDTRKIILFIIIRAQKPCKLTAANFVDLNLTAFSTILSRSWSYFALLKTVYS